MTRAQPETFAGLPQPRMRIRLDRESEDDAAVILLDESGLMKLSGGAIVRTERDLELGTFLRKNGSSRRDVMGNFFSVWRYAEHVFYVYATPKGLRAVYMVEGGGR